MRERKRSSRARRRELPSQPAVGSGGYVRSRRRRPAHLLMPSATSAARDATPAARAANALAGEGYLVMLVCGIAIVLLLGIGAFVMSDTWLALAAGRVVAAHGPPAHDTLTAWTL